MQDKGPVYQEYLQQNPVPQNPNAEPLPQRRLPQAGEGLHGERTSPLPSLKEDFPSPGSEDSYNNQEMERAERAGQVVSRDEYHGEHLHPRAFGPESPVSALDEWQAKSGGRK